MSVGIYRIDTLFHNTTSLTSTAPGTLNSTLSKAGFYVFDVAPEVLRHRLLLRICKELKSLPTQLLGRTTGSPDHLIIPLWGITLLANLRLTIYITSVSRLPLLSKLSGRT